MRASRAGAGEAAMVGAAVFQLRSQNLCRFALSMLVLQPAHTMLAGSLSRGGGSATTPCSITIPVNIAAPPQTSCTSATSSVSGPTGELLSSSSPSPSRMAGQSSSAFGPASRPIRSSWRCRCTWTRAVRSCRARRRRESVLRRPSTFRVRISGLPFRVRMVHVYAKRQARHRQD